VTHHRHGAVLWPVVGQITPGILLGTLLGTLFAASVPARPLAVFFTVFVCLVAVQMILNLKPKASRELPGAAGVFAVGTGIGALSALVAIGGGSLTVPFLTWCNVRVQHAIGTSAAVGFPDRRRRLARLHLQRLGAPRPAAVEPRLRLPAGAALAGAIEHADRTPRGKTGTPLPVATLKRLFAGVLIVLAAKDAVGLFAG
jgi:uncharacterized membrane protein YfcA